MKKIRSEFLELTINEDFGGKVLSIRDSSKEYLFGGNSSIKPDSKTPFESGFDYGLDECFPTIDPVVFEGRKYRDHGDIWRLEWDLEANDSSILGSAYSDTSRLNFSRKISIVDNTIYFQYEIENKNDHIEYFLYTLHPLFNFDEDSYFELPFDKEKTFKLVGMDALEGRDIEKLSSYPDGGRYKFYNDYHLSSGIAFLYYPSEKKVLRLEFDKEALPYFGIWISKAGGKYNMAFEPSNGFYDRLDRAVANGLKPIKPGEIIRFSHKIIIERMD